VLYFPARLAHGRGTMKRLNLAHVGCWVSVWLLALTPVVAQTPDLPHFQELLRLLRTNLPGVTDDDLNRAAARGLLEGFGPRVQLVTNAAALTAANEPLVSRSAVYERSFGYVRLSRVAAGLADEFGAALTQLRTAQKLKGLVLDLRFADGEDYAAAAGLADRFLTKEQPLLQWGESSARSTAKAEAVQLPLAVLVNGETRGAAEALAEVLRTSRVALLVGRPTAGQAFTFREFTLDDGARLRIAGASIQVGDDLVLTNRVTPDLAVEVPAEQERVHFADPFKVLTVASTTAETAPLGLSARTNRGPRPRLNEAELVRRRREQLSLDDPSAPPARPDSVREEKVLQDAVLVRALDLLKGIAVVGSPPAAK
jgi:hypothetical protein